jgi:hypothetical protein
VLLYWLTVAALLSMIGSSALSSFFVVRDDFRRRRIIIDLRRNADSALDMTIGVHTPSEGTLGSLPIGGSAAGRPLAPPPRLHETGRTLRPNR